MEILIMNFGSPNFMCDKFGPVLGDKLEEAYKDNELITVVGTTQSPLCSQEHIYNAIKLEEYALQRCAIVICTDAAVGPTGTEGELYWRKGQLKPGHVTGKESAFMGHWVMQYSIGDGRATAPTEKEISVATDEALAVLHKHIKLLCT